MKTITNTIKSEVCQRNAIWILAFILVILGVAYAYMVNQAVLNVVARENLEIKISELSSEVSKMEAKYIEMANQIDLNLAYQLGFEEAPAKKYVSRKSNEGSFSLNGRE